MQACAEHIYASLIPHHIDIRLREKKRRYMDNNSSMMPRRRHAVPSPPNGDGGTPKPSHQCKQQQQAQSPPAVVYPHRDWSAFAVMSVMLILIGALAVGCTDPTVFNQNTNDNNKVKMMTRQVVGGQEEDIPDWDDDFPSVQEPPCGFTVLPCMTSRAPCCALFISEENVGLRLLGADVPSLADQITQSLECSMAGTNYTNQTLASMCNANPSDPASRIPVQVSQLAGAE